MHIYFHRNKSKHLQSSCMSCIYLWGIYGISNHVIWKNAYKDIWSRRLRVKVYTKKIYICICKQNMGLFCQKEPNNYVIWIYDYKNILFTGLSFCNPVEVCFSTRGKDVVCFFQMLGGGMAGQYRYPKILSYLNTCIIWERFLLCNIMSHNINIILFGWLLSKIKHFLILLKWCIYWRKR